MTRTFNIFGRFLLQVESTPNGWQAYYLGNEGKKRAATDVQIPPEVTDAQLADYLSDLFHEYATVENAYILERP